jgi:photosystem II stability/assembly factor-like uncharacterized protein
MRSKRWAVGLVAGLACLAAGAPAAAAAVSVGHSGWIWGNPLPQGNTIRVLDFNGGTGYAAGDFGTLLKTTDAGATWTGVPTGITSDLNRIDVISPTSVVIGGGCSARRSDDGGATFHRLPFTPSELRCKEDIQSMSFPTGDAGFVLLRDGTLVATGDGGTTFSPKTAIPNSPAKGGSQQPTDIFFTTIKNGVAVTGGPGGGGIYHTQDGGNTWTQVPGVTGSFHSVWFADGNTGYAVGDAGALFTTTDRGSHWIRRPLTGATTANLTSIRCAGVICLITVDNGSHIVRTTDAGFTGMDVSASNQQIFAAGFASPTQAVAAGQDGATVVSGDAGVTFSPVPAGGGRIAGPFSQLRAASASVAFATGSAGTLARTTDAGRTWTNVGVPTTGDVIDASFPFPSTGYALDSSGTLLRSKNGGGSWSLLNTGTQTQPASVLALDANRVLLIGPRGLRRSHNGGNSFAGVRGAIAHASIQRADLAHGAVFAYGPRALFVSTNGGANWTAVNRPPRKSSLRTVDFITRKRGFVLDRQGRVWATSNRGKHWTQLVATGTLSAYDLAFTAANRGYLAINSFGIQRGGFLLKTSDGGKTWHPQLVSSHALTRYGIATSGGATDFATDTSGALFATTTGGDQGSASSLKLRTKKLRVTPGSDIRVTGKLSPAEGGEQVVVSARSFNRGWVHKVVQVAANGTFTTVWKLTRFTIFVAQWAGDADHAGAGSKVLQIQVGQ